MEQPSCCLSIGGSDSGGGAGIQADLRVFHQLGVHGCSALTALTAQNPNNIRHISEVPVEHMQQELHAIFDYYQVLAVKTGMLLDAAHISALVAVLQQRHQGGVLIVDPVMIASSGRCLLAASAVTSLQCELLPLATLMTPNVDEALALLGSVDDDDSVELASRLLLRYRCPVLLKGGHRSAETLHDVLCMSDGYIYDFKHPQQVWTADQAHGTGCRLAAAITALLALGQSLPEAVRQAVLLLQQGALHPKE